MHCPRCQGLMVATSLEDWAGSASRDRLIGWNCLLCGEVLDPGIAANRKQRHEPVRNRARPRYGTLLERTTSGGNP